MATGRTCLTCLSSPQRAASIPIVRDSPLSIVHVFRRLPEAHLLGVEDVDVDEDVDEDVGGSLGTVLLIVRSKKLGYQRKSGSKPAKNSMRKSPIKLAWPVIRSMQIGGFALTH